MSPARSMVTTHVLDTSRGRPAAGVGVRFERVTDRGAEAVGGGTTDADGRLRDLGPEVLDGGTYRLVFGTGDYFAGLGEDTLYPEVAITFTLAADGGHYHVPLLVSPFGYTTYRGS